MRIKVKSSLFLISCCFLLSYQSFSTANEVAPLVLFDRFEGEVIGGNERINLSIRGSDGDFHRFMGESILTPEVKAKFDEALDFGAHWQTLENAEFRILSQSSQEGYHFHYLIQQNQVVGYQLLEELMILDDENRPDSAIRRMKSLPRRHVPLSPLLQNNPNITLDIYEQAHDGYMERYIFVTHKRSMTGNSDHYLVGDGFYPLYLDTFMIERAVALLKQEYLL